MGVKLKMSLKIGMLFQWISFKGVQSVGLLPPTEVTSRRLKYKYITMMSAKHTCILSQAHRLIKFVQMYKSVKEYTNIPFEFILVCF